MTRPLTRNASKNQLSDGEPGPDPGPLGAPHQDAAASQDAGQHDPPVESQQAPPNPDPIPIADSPTPSQISLPDDPEVLQQQLLQLRRENESLRKHSRQQDAEEQASQDHPLQRQRLDENALHNSAPAHSAHHELNHPHHAKDIDQSSTTATQPPPQLPAVSMVVSFPAQPQFNSSLTAPATGFSPLTSVGVPNVAPGVDLAVLLAQRQSACLSRFGDPSVKIDGSDRQAFRPWERAVTLKIQSNLLCLLYHAEQINYALLQMSGNLLTSMSHWISVRPTCSFQAFLQEVKSFMGVQFLEQEAREKLRSIRQNYPSETVSELYTRVVPLFNDAQTPVAEQIKRFLNAMHTNIARNLSGGSYVSLEALRDVAVTAEACYRRFDRSLHRGPTSGSGTSSSGPRGRGRDNRDALNP
ncbi:hypothetical protein KEM56_000853 [Ascosphaera pollenicola]|nr:hypothetical protein KEM56_000853 [Ascosphaera pollenicola]